MIWKGRNRRTFEDIKITFEGFKRFEVSDIELFVRVILFLLLRIMGTLLTFDILLPFDSKKDNST